MSSLLAVVSLIVSTPIQSTQPPRSQLEVPAGNLSGRDLTVQYEFIDGQILFIALLPEGWSFSLNVDGDQNGVWGNGNGTDPALMTNSEDIHMVAQNLVTCVPSISILDQRIT